MKNEEIRNLKHGNKVSCYLDGQAVIGAISIENKGSGKYIVHLCNNIIAGTFYADELFGYDYSSIIGSIDNKFANYNKRVTGLSMLQSEEMLEDELLPKRNEELENEKLENAEIGFQPMLGRFEKTKPDPIQKENKPLNDYEIEPYTNWIQRREDAIAKAIANRALKLKEIPVDWINEYNNNLRHLAVTVVLVLFSLVTQAQVTKYIGHKYPSDTITRTYCGHQSTIVFKKTAGIINKIIIFPGKADTITPVYRFQVEQLINAIEKKYNIKFTREYYPDCSDDAYLRARKSGLIYEGYIEHAQLKSPGFLFTLIISK